MYKRILVNHQMLLSSFWLMTLAAYVQAQSPRAVPAAYASAVNKNYVRIWTATAPESSPTTQITRPLQDVKQVTQYFDGLGRPLQTVAKQASFPTNGTAVDLISPVEYDAYGREPFKYLSTPSTATDATKNDGNFKLNPFIQQAAFYDNLNTTSNPIAGQGETFFYGTSSLESSPLNRVLESAAPGNSWSGSMWQTAEANRHSVKIKSCVNTATDAVRIWNVTVGAIGSFSTYASSGAYAAGLLIKTITVDETGKQVIEFKDNEGKLILKKAQNTAAADAGLGSSHTGWLCTYYLYDDLNNLRCVIQPRGVELIAATWALTDANILAEQCFRYEYDQRNRMIIKKVPGAGDVRMVYDQWDRLVLSQDANLRALNQWLFTKYDTLNRPIMTGLYTNTTNTTQAAMQTFLNSQNLGRYESLGPTAVPFYTLNQTFPVEVANDVQSMNFYDDYNWTNNIAVGFRTFDNTYVGYFWAGDNINFPYPRALTPSNNTRGLGTGSVARVPGVTLLATTNFYDDHNRVIQTKHENVSGHYDQITTQYTFSGQVLMTMLIHDWPTKMSAWVFGKYAYDVLGRLLTVKNNATITTLGVPHSSPEQLISTNTYNELGQLKNKSLGNNIENLAYDYNIRGWLRTINKNYVSGSVSTNYFGMELGYDKTTSVNTTTSYASTQFNGNITGTVWKSAGDGVGRKYDFTYDNMNRLTAANFLQNSTGSSWDNATINFTTDNLTYDANGNIMSMRQKGFKVGGSANIDDLSYVYKNTNGSNQLITVNDAANDASSKLGDFHYTGAKQPTDYTYDANGNLTVDNNKGITATMYNYLNLPLQITFGTKGSITYVYDANGNKLSKTTVDNTVSPAKTTVTTYMAGFVYNSETPPGGGPLSMDLLQFFSHEEGRGRWAYHKYLNGTSEYKLEYDYFVKDHLGNTRVVLSQQKDTAQYLATMEAAFRSTEVALFNNITNTSYKRSLVSGYPNDVSITNPNDSVAKVNGSGQKTGPSILLKVMSGDKIDIAVQSYYNSGTNTTQNPSITDVLNSLANGIVTMAGGAKGSITDLNNTGASPIYAALNSFLGTNDPNTTGKPKAYLNWILLDEQLKYVSSYPQSGAAVVGGAATLNTIGYTGLPITKNGYLYIWVSNETVSWDVFFDNLSIKHYTGPLLEETHYYPFGLTMAGISSKALKTNYAENRYKFNKGSELQSKEFTDGSGLEIYETPLRSLDPQLGRWCQIDSKPDDSQSPYQSMDNNPILLNDPKGDCPQCIIGLFVGLIVDYTVQVTQNLANGQDLGSAMTNINGKEMAVAGTAGFFTGGLSAITSGTTAVVSQALVAGTTSVLNQVNSNVDKGVNAMNISVPKVALDIVTDNVANKVSKNVGTADTKSATQQLDRAERVAANDATSTGRQDKLDAARSNLNGINNSNSIKQTAASNLISSTAGSATESNNSKSKIVPVVPLIKNDGTYLKRPEIVKLNSR